MDRTHESRATPDGAAGRDAHRDWSRQVGDRLSEVQRELPAQSRRHGAVAEPQPHGLGSGIQNWIVEIMDSFCFSWWGRLSIDGGEGFDRWSKAFAIAADGPLGFRERG